MQVKKLSVIIHYETPKVNEQVNFWGFNIFRKEHHACHFFFNLYPIKKMTNRYKALSRIIYQLPAANWFPANEKARIIGNLPKNVAIVKAKNVTPDIPAMRLIHAEGRMGMSLPISTAMKPFVWISDRKRSKRWCFNNILLANVLR